MSTTRSKSWCQIPWGNSPRRGDPSPGLGVVSGEGLTHHSCAHRYALTFISIKSSRTECHTGVHLLMVIEPAAAGQALGWAPARTGLTPLVAPATASCCCVPKVAQRAHAHALPVGTGATEDISHPTPPPPCKSAACWVLLRQSA